MIETRQVGGCFGPFHVFVDNVAVCRVEYAWSVVASDYVATKARAEHIAEALRHYQASQEGERVL